MDIYGLDNLSASLTPPVSDEEPEQDLDQELLQPEEKVFEVTCFQCLGEVDLKKQVYHSNSYLRSGFLENVFGNIGTRYGHEFRWVRIFGHPWTAHLSEVNYIKDVFLMLRQKIGYIQNKALITNTIIDEEREEVNKCLEFILIQVRNNNLESTEVACILLKELHTVLNHVGRISDTPQLFINSHIDKMIQFANKCLVNKERFTQFLEFPLSCYFHLHLDIYWRVLCIVHLIQTSNPDVIYNQPVCDMEQDDQSLPVYDQVLHIILWDLVTIGQIRLNNKNKGCEYRKVSLFPCACVQELWLLCIKLSQLRTREINGEFFWLSLHHVIHTISGWKKEEGDGLMEAEDCCIIINPPDMFNVEDATSLCLWILSNVTPLVTEGSQDVNKTTDVFVSNYHDLEMILNKFLSDPHISESALKRHLHTCLYITSHWEPSTKLINRLWDFFYRRLNDTFQDNTSVMDGLACVDKTVLGFYRRCKKLISGYEENVDKETSFHLFMRILSQHLLKLYKGDDTREWKQLKGRIYTKFFPRSIQALRECGLFNLTCMFITLGLTTNLKEVASKLCDFYDMVDFEHITLGKRLVIWRGAFTLMLICEDKGLDTSFIAERMASALEHCVIEFNDGDVSTKHKVWELVQTYLDGTQEVVDMSTTLTLSEFKLIGSGIGSLLPVCSENQLRHVLAVIQSLLNKIRQVASVRDICSPTNIDQYTEFAERLWKHVYRYIVDRSQTSTPPAEMADIAAEFCLLALNFPPPATSKETFLSIFQTFASVETTNSSITCRFLGHLLVSNEVIARLQSDLGSWEPYVIRCWFQCCVLVPGPSDILEQVTRSVLQFSEVKSIFNQACMDLPCALGEAPIQFLRALHQAYGNIKSWPEKMAYQEKIIPYFTDLHKCCIPVLRNLGPTSVLSNMYCTVGNMIKYCAKLIYIRQDPIVPAILSSMILPQQIMDKDKPVHPGLLAVIRDNLHLFVQGLGRLAYERDVFVQRKLKEIILTYLPKFTLRPSSNVFEVNSTTSVHPLVVSLGGSFTQQPSQEAIKFRHYVMQVVVDNFLVVKNMAVHPQHSMSWMFLSRVVQRTVSPSVLARDFQELLLLCLEYLLLLREDSAAFLNMLSVLQHTAEAHVSCPDGVPISKVTETCQAFLKTYNRFSIQGVIKVMERLAVLHKQAVISVIKELSTAVREIENKRGVGMDHVLRKKYYQLLRMLGDSGEEEIARLQSTS